MRQEISSIELEELQDNQNDQESSLVSMEMGLIGHVSVNASVNVGSVDVSIEKLFSLKPGETLSLNESVDSPIKLMVDGKVVALGNLVAVEDNFGIHITEVSDK